MLLRQPVDGRPYAALVIPEHRDLLGGVRRGIGLVSASHVDVTPRLAARDVDGAPVHEDAEPGANRSAVGVEPSGSAPQVDEPLLNRVLCEGRVPKHAKRDAAGDREVAFVKLGERGVVASSRACKQLGIGGVQILSHILIDRGNGRPVTIPTVRGGPGGARSGATQQEARLLDALRNGDETAFVQVVDCFTPAMLRLARVYGLTAPAAEDVVQETWVRVLGALEGFEGRSSFRTWLFAILANCARERAGSERRSVPVSDFGAESDSAAEEGRFFPAGHPRWAGMWTTLVDSWETVPDDRLLAGEARGRFSAAIDELPARHAAVFVLRDVEGWSSDEVCELLDLSPENQRVLLHRARARLRAGLEEYLEGGA